MNQAVVVVVSRKLNHSFSQWVPSGVYPMPLKDMTDETETTVSKSMKFADDMIKVEKDKVIAKFPEFCGAEWKADFVPINYDRLYP